ncbi:MAG: DUF1249 domain-containing protein [Thiohalobacteraceae bacterium]
MAIYECNYIRLRQLLPGLTAAAMGSVSRVEGALDLHLRVVERNRYTTTLHLTYLFKDELGLFPAPDIQVRIYHDARLAEVLSCGRLRSRREAARNCWRRDSSLDDKWRINRFLQKWLGYCLRQGHRFRATPDAVCVSAGSWPEVLAEFACEARKPA